MPHATRPSFVRSLSSYALRDKQRMYVALYPRDSGYSTGGCCDSFHWAIITAPQGGSRDDPSTRYHVAHAASRFARKSSVHAFAYEENDLSEAPNAASILVRVTIAKVLDLELVSKVLRSITPPDEEQGETCLTWLKQAFEALHETPGCLRSYLKPTDFREVEMCCREYCKLKRRQRRFAEDPELSELIPTWNFVEDRETTA